MSNPYPENTSPADGSDSGTRFGLRRPKSMPGVRVIVNLNSSPRSFEPFALMTIEDLNHAPAEVAQRGVSDAVWKEWMTRFQQEIVVLHMDSCIIVLFLVLIVGIPYICYRSRKLQKRALRFQQDFNKQVMEPLGMYFKTQTSLVMLGDGFDVAKDSDVASAVWASIALTKAEVERLKAEEHCFTYDVSKDLHTASRSRNACRAAICCCGVEQVM